MSRQPRGTMSRSMSNQRGRGGKAGGKAGKRTLGEGVREALLAAVAQAEAGQHADAANAMRDIAQTAGNRGKPAAAASISVQGAQAALAGGDQQLALSIAQAGVELSAGVAETRRVARKFAPFIDALAAVDADAAASFEASTRSAYGLKLIPRPGATVKPNRAQRRSLPKACPCCGVKLDASTIEFVDDGTLDCPLCGDSIV